MVISLVPRPTLTRGETSTDTSGAGFINIDCFLGGGGEGEGGIFQPPIKLQKTQSVAATPEIVGYFSTITQQFLCVLN